MCDPHYSLQPGRGHSLFPLIPLPENWHHSLWVFFPSQQSLYCLGVVCCIVAGKKPFFITFLIHENIFRYFHDNYDNFCMQWRAVIVIRVLKLSQKRGIQEGAVLQIHLMSDKTNFEFFVNKSSTCFFFPDFQPCNALFIEDKQSLLGLSY